MALFFDLGVPYLEREGGGAGASSENKARKDARLRVVVRAMELGYVGVAYDRPVRGVLSEAERCRIAPFPLSSLLKVAPALAASTAFHRDLLGAPCASPFRQYTRLTISVHSAAAVINLNGNALLRTYDLVALRPLNQEAFDKACESSEVDIIAMDFSQKLPFRLKLHSIKLAIQRGLYFEITYSHLSADVHVRRQIMSDAKLLSDWTRGKNLIFSSAAPTANEIRGPYDVMNLVVFLLGLSSERARFAISQNCRSLVANALRKKHFYKETIRIERIIPDEQSNTKRFWFDDWNEWDAISSEKGDLPSLDNITKTFSSTSRQSVSSNSIDFLSISNEAPFLLGENAMPSSKLQSPSSPNEIPFTAAADATQDVSVDVNSSLHKISMSLTTTGQQNHSREKVLVFSGDTTLLVDSEEACQPVEFAECLKISNKPAMVSCTGMLPSTNAASKVDGCLPSDADLTSTVVMENKPSDIFMEVHQSSDQSDNHLIETSDAELMDCNPNNDDLASNACNCTHNNDGRNNVNFLPSSVDPTPLVVLENKPFDMFLKVKKSSDHAANHAIVTSNDAECMTCITENDDLTRKACNYTYNDNDFPPSDANVTPLVVMENEPSYMFVDVQKRPYQSDNHVIESSNDAAGIRDHIFDVGADQRTHGDEGPCFTSFMQKKMMKVQGIPRILEQEPQDKKLTDHCIPLQKSHIHSVLNDQRAGLKSSEEDVILKDALKETKEQKVCSFEVKDQVEKKQIVVKEEIQKSDTKLGRGKPKERLFYPFKGLFKPMLLKRKFCNRRRRKHL